MKAYLLAAGRGTRLRPLTDRLPKCLVEIGGEPLLGRWIGELARAGVDQVLVNTHHLPGPVREYVGRDPVPGVAVRLVHEEILLGSAGTVSAHRDFVRSESSFFIVYADNLTDTDLADFLRFHRALQSPFTMGLFETPQPRECGIAELDGDGRVVSFEEKPREPRSNLANAGLYLATPELFDILPDRTPLDFGFDILPLMAGRMYGYCIRGLFCDIGTPERLAWARGEWTRRHGAGPGSHTASS